jgi:hypothetical protein
MAGPDIKGTRAEAVRVGRPNEAGDLTNMSGKPPIKGTRVPAAPAGAEDSGTSTKTGASLAFEKVRAEAPTAKRGKY